MGGRGSSSGISKGLSSNDIESLEKKGFKRWQKDDKDRLYINGWQLDGVQTNWKKNGKKTYSIDGEELSYTKSAILGQYGAKNYIDVKTGEIFTSTDDARLKDFIMKSMRRMKG